MISLIQEPQSHTLVIHICEVRVYGSTNSYPCYLFGSEGRREEEGGEVGEEGEGRVPS